MYPDPGPLPSENSDQMIRFYPLRFLSGRKVQFHLSRRSYRKFHSNGKRSLKYGSQSIQTSLKIVWTLKICYQFCDNCWIPSCTYYLKEAEMKIAIMFAHFKDHHVNHAMHFKSLYHFGGRCLKIRDICTDFEPYFKVRGWSLLTLKASYLIKWPVSTWSSKHSYSYV